MPDLSARSPADRFRRYFTDLNFILVVYTAVIAIATVVKLMLGPFPHNGLLYQPLQNFAIFRNSFFHLVHHQDLYAAFPLEQWDLFKYSPAFSLLMAPFALFPYPIGAVLWNLANALALYFAIRSIPQVGQNVKACILWFVLLNLLSSAQNAQSNGLTAALMIGAFNAQAGRKSAAAGLFIALGAGIKLFGVAALLPCLLLDGRLRLIFWTGVWSVAVVIAPVVVVSPSELAGLYRSWNSLLHEDYSGKTGLSVMSLLKSWSGLRIPSGPVVLCGAAMLIVPLLRNPIRPDHRFVRQVAASVLLWVILFNHMAESPTLVIAVAGAALWYFPQRRSLINTILIILVFLFAGLSPTDLCPQPIREHFITRYLLVTAPCLAVWLKIQYDLLRYRATPRLPKRTQA